jgi:hypothetical protein
MAPRKGVISPQREGRIQLAILALRNKRIKEVSRAAKVYQVPTSSLRDRLRGRTPQRGSRAANQLLSNAEEIAPIQWISRLERQGFPPYIINVRRIAQALVDKRGPVTPARKAGQQCVYRFLKKHPTLNTRLSRKKDYQRAKCENPAITKEWFERVQQARQEYGILDVDTYNIDQTGFAMGIATGSGASKSITAGAVGRVTQI